MGYHLVRPIRIQALFQVSPLCPAELQGILPLPFRWQPVHPAGPIRLTPIHQRPPTTASHVADLTHRSATAIQSDGLQAFQFPRVLCLPFGSPQGILFFFSEYKLSFCHTLYYATSFSFVHELVAENALLRQQVIVLNRSVKHPKLTGWDRCM